MNDRQGIRAARASTARLALSPSTFAPDGALPLANVATARRVAARFGAVAGSTVPSDVLGGELNAFGIVDLVLHHVIGRYVEEVAPDALDVAVDIGATRLGVRPVADTLDGYRDDFPLDRAVEPPDAVADLLLTWVANANPATAPFRELVDDRPLASTTSYRELLVVLDQHFRDLPPFGPDEQSLLDMLRAPALASPDSLAGQLAFIRDRWGSLLGDLMDRLLVAIAVLEEDERGRWMRFHGWTGGAGAHAGAIGIGPAPGSGEDEPERFSADRDWMPRVVMLAKSTYVWLDQLSRHHGREIRTLDAIPDEELDRLARWGVTGLWLIGLWQRSRASERIKRWRGNPEAVASAYSLDEYRIADDLGGEAAWANLRDRAWARGIRLASDMVPNHMGIDSRWVIEHPDWFLSLREPPYPAYTFDGADLADDPRVAVRIEDHYWDDSDAAVVFKRVDEGSGDVRYIYHGNDGTSMPWNDTAQLDYSRAEVREAVIQTILDVARRFPIIRFDAAMTLARKHIQRLWFPLPGAGGAIPSRAEHAMTQAAFDAAIPVEFWREVVDRVAAEVPDTLLLAEAFWLMEGYFVRTLGMHRVYNSAFMNMLRDEDNTGYRRVIKNTLEFDPEILKRYVNFMNNPDEKTAVEQFGKGDKYFGVATLMATLPGLPMFGHGQVEGFAEKYGMEYRRAYLDEERDHWLVERHERELFPLFHRRGQFAEVRDFLLYDVVDDGGGVLEDVYAFSNGRGTERSLVVFHNRYASVAGRIRNSVTYASSVEGGKRPTRRTLAEGWGLADDPAGLVRFRDLVSGLEYLHRVGEIRERGLAFRLEAYGRRVFLDVVEVHDGAAGLWGRLADRLGGQGVPSLDGAMRTLELEPVHAALRRVLEGETARTVAAALEPVTTGASAAAGPGPMAPEGSPMAGLDRSALAPVGGPDGGRTDAGPTETVPAAPSAGVPPRPGPGAVEAALADLAARQAGFLRAVADATGTSGDPAPIVVASTERLVRAVRAAERAGETPSPNADPLTERLGDPGDRAALLGWSMIGELGRLAPAADPEATTRAWTAELQLVPPLAEGLRAMVADEGVAWRAAEQTVALAALPDPAAPSGPRGATGLLERWLAAPAVRRLLGVNTWEGVEWLSADGLLAVAGWTRALAALRAIGPSRTATLDADLEAIGGAAATAGYRLAETRAVLAAGEPTP